MAVIGVGWVGKSALVARFALDLPDDELIMWLDFDRADLAADDPRLVLRLILEQLALQRADFNSPDVDKEEWAGALEGLGGRLGADGPALLVLDGFEVAQHAQAHREIWTLLENVAAEIPNLRVLVSGRAPVDGAVLSGREVKTLKLTGLELNHASAWLRDAGVDDDAVIARVVALTRGMPLALRLAVRLLEERGRIADLPLDLPEALVHGVLYRRILDRVVDPWLKEVARDAIVLRRITPELVTDLLADSAGGAL